MRIGMPSRTRSSKEEEKAASNWRGSGRENQGRGEEEEKEGEEGREEYRGAYARRRVEELHDGVRHSRLRPGLERNAAHDRVEGREVARERLDGRKGAQEAVGGLGGYVRRK